MLLKLKYYYKKIKNNKVVLIVLMIILKRVKLNKHKVMVSTILYKEKIVIKKFKSVNQVDYR